MKNLCRAFSFALVIMGVMAIPAPTVSARAEEDDFHHAIALDTGKVKEILESDMIMLDDDKRYRLENILIPPYEDAPAEAELNKVLLNKQVTVYTYNEAAKDRGLPLVQVVTDKNVWIQGDLVSKGYAWAFSTASSPQMVDALKMLEDTAREQRLGFWKDQLLYAVKTPKTVKSFMNSYQVVEGRILNANIRDSGTIFLSFGKNPKTDFQIRARDNFMLSQVKDPEKPEGAIPRKEGMILIPLFDPRKWKGRIVRVRGWVHGSGAPVIDLTQKEQIDFVEEATAAGEAETDGK